MANWVKEVLRGNKLQSTLILISIIMAGTGLALWSKDEPIRYGGFWFVAIGILCAVISFFSNLKIEHYESIIKNLQSELKEARSHSRSMAAEAERITSTRGLREGKEQKNLVNLSEQESSTSDG